VNYTFGKHRLLFIVIGVAVVALASSIPHERQLPNSAANSCGTKTLDTMRNMTRNDVLPSEDAVAAIENQFPNTKAAGLARVCARIKLNAKDYAGAASLLDARSFATRLRFTTMRFPCAACVGANRKDAEARAVYQELCTSIQRHSVA
jgi:hypothetical protein